jgi:hypothetical protein
MEEERSQPSTNSMTSEKSCYYSGCALTPKWGVTSGAKARQPDGSPLTLFACDGHYSEITGDLRQAGTKYTLFPINGPHIVSPCDHKCDNEDNPFESYEQELSKMPLPLRIVVTGATFAVMIVIGPPMIVYYTIKWVSGWRPKG